MFLPLLWNDNDTDLYRDPFDEFDKAMRSFRNGNDLKTISTMRTDVIEEDGNYRLECELPGFNKNDIKLDLKKGVLTIEANHNSDDEEKNKSGKVIRRERTSASYRRSFSVSADLKAEDITAKYENGILTVVVPKKDKPQEEAASTSINID